MKHFFLFSLAALSLLVGCKKNEPVLPIDDLVVEVTTSSSDDVFVTFNSATLRGTVKLKGTGEGVTSGFRYWTDGGEKQQTTATPTSDGKLEVEITGLTSGEKYYYEAFAENSNREEKCGEQYSFITFTEGPVDLGLPSGIKWAACNVDAELPTDFGGYYAWGEVETKSKYDWYTYKYCKDGDNEKKSITKYITEMDYYLESDSKSILDASDDVAKVKMSGSWRMPTSVEANELLQNCDAKRVNINGVDGYRYINKKTMDEKVFIFIPSAGRMSNGAISSYSLEIWTASLYSDIFSTKAYKLDASSISQTDRKFGLPVRAVAEIRKTTVFKCQ